MTRIGRHDEDNGGWRNGYGREGQGGRELWIRGGEVRNFKKGEKKKGGGLQNQVLDN